jgi:hypothetical protein
VDLQLSSYGVHPSKLAALVAAHAKAAGAAFASLDPDNDGDIDGVTDDDDSQSCSSCGEPMDSDARYCPACSYPAGETNTPQTTTEVDASADPKEPVMGEPTAEAAKAAEEARQAAATEQAAAITKAVTEGIAAGLAADRAARAEETVALEAKAAADKKAAEEAAAAAAVTEAATAELRASIRKELLAEQRNAGRPVRKGVVRVIDEAYDPSTLTRAERDEVLGDTLVHRLFPHLENSIA